ncbi:glycosyltransferase [Salinibacterium sp. dk2585]|uniref:glycosyltransferase n=1 Tax=unclassified Salinibacterium TaxID=2632331 RepID=UPI0011C24643|nr:MULTISPECIES: glycosyltransferase [unclassified Salinibacterium]QEE60499.1 glycosyltransferase [Salinibacterium sp. dk2585]TXK55571.1 glycosyltransferase [Salinibacterium sp. dk5596]
MAGTARAGRRLIVLQSVRELRDTTNPYLVQLVQALKRSADVRLFSWPRAILGRWDVLHVHWPELLFVRESRLRTLVGAALCLALELRLRLGRGALVRTAHNVRPHEGRGRLVEFILARLDRATDVWVLLNDTTPIAAAAERVVIPHGHYADWYASRELPTPREGRLLFFGLIRAYKNVPALARSFTTVPDAAASLHIVGRPDPAALAEELRSIADGDERIQLTFGYADDDQLIREFGEASLVALPYRDLHNSGAMLLALSLGRPVLVPDNPATAAIAEEVGEAWVRRYQGELTGETLSEALAAGTPAGAPDLSRRSWLLLGEAHVAAYRRALAKRAHRPYSE